MIQQKLHALIQLQTLSANKPCRVPSGIENIKETQSMWEIGVTHRLFSGASTFEIAALEDVLVQATPTQLTELLTLTNGAELFCVNTVYNVPGTDQKYSPPRYQVLSTMEIAETYEEMLEVAKSYEEDTRDYFEQHDGRMNYLPFCALKDGHYLALHTETGQLFFLDRGYDYFPYGLEVTQDAYVHVASSIEEWLDKLIETHGFAGMGGAFLEKYV